MIFSVNTLVTQINLILHITLLSKLIETRLIIVFLKREQIQCPTTYFQETCYVQRRVGVDQAGTTGSNRAAGGLEARQMGSNQSHRNCNTFVLEPCGIWKDLSITSRGTASGSRCRSVPEIQAELLARHRNSPGQ